MLSFILRLVATQVIKRNFDYVQERLKVGSKYLYNRLYTDKREKQYPDLTKVKITKRSNSI